MAFMHSHLLLRTRTGSDATRAIEAGMAINGCIVDRGIVHDRIVREIVD